MERSKLPRWEESNMSITNQKGIRNLFAKHFKRMANSDVSCGYDGISSKALYDYFVRDTEKRKLIDES